MKQGGTIISSSGSKERVISAFFAPRVSMRAPSGDSNVPEMQECSVGIQCLNCQETVPEYLIEDHSLYCTSSEPYFGNDQEALLKALRSFASFLESRNSSELSPLIDILNSLLNGTVSDSFLKDIEDLPTSQSDSIQFYKEKAYYLCGQLVLFNKDKTKVEKLRTKIDNLKKTNSIAETGTAFKLTEGRRPTSPVMIGKQSTFRSTEHSNLHDHHDDELKRQFLALCVNAKIKFRHNHQAQEIDIERMYEEVKRFEIKPGKWGNYVQEYLNNAQNKEEVINRFANDNSFDQFSENPYY